MEQVTFQTPLKSTSRSESLYSLVIHLGAAQEGRFSATLSRAIHSQVIQWFSRTDPAIAEAIHNAQVSPLTISNLKGYRRRPKTKLSDDFYIRISLLDGNLLDPLLSGLEQWGTQPVIIANYPFAFRGVDTLPGTHPQVGIAKFSLLSKAKANDAEITLEFLSPTSFKQQKYIQTFPLPQLVFNSLLRRWNAFAPEHLQFPFIEWIGMVSAFNLKTHALRLEGGPEIGAQGWVKYRFPDPQQARIATVLSHFACFAGVGRKTTMGMGQTRLKQSSSKLS